MSETYEEFIAKFNKTQTKTTDDCYTPKEVYEAVLDYVCNRYGVRAEDVIRPFFPGGDYQKENYDGKVVVDNPPFSIIKKIVEYYLENDIPFFLFCHGLTNTFMKIGKDKITFIPFDTIKYENGAKVNTGFVTNLEHDSVIRIDTEFVKNLTIACNRKFRDDRVQRPFNYISFSDITKFVANDIEFELDWSDISGFTQYLNGYKFYGLLIILNDTGVEKYERALREYIFKKYKIK